LATAICSQAPFGTLWFEQTAMLFDLLALQAMVESFRASGYRRGLWQLAGGFSLGLAALSKQNYWLCFIPIALAVVATGELPDLRRTCRAVLLAGTGTAATISIFLGWVWAFSTFSRLSNALSCSLMRIPSFPALGLGSHPTSATFQISAIMRYGSAGLRAINELHNLARTAVC
jgi:4-amino-4-deoxy-L-arabinose transferase-like glycosyltransferase